MALRNRRDLAALPPKFRSSQFRAEELKLWEVSEVELLALHV